MPESGQINLNKVKATYSIGDIELVDRRDLESANESRFYGEIGFAIGLTFLGNLFGNFNWPMLAATGAFIAFGSLMFWRFKHKNEKINQKISSGGGDGDASLQQKIMNLLYEKTTLTIEEIMGAFKLDYASAKIILRRLVSSYLVKFSKEPDEKTYFFVYEKEGEFRSSRPKQKSKFEIEDLPF
ncbi:hypothetical protein C4571_00595 [Candidatus Parcubacteria bacterium]|nr:MAG: hypothetical protein C4571_00595 [Candidatus Parcubacteria bacterium]